MKTVLHKAESRGEADHGWLKTAHSFSFAGWHEPTRMGFGALRVLNDDWIAPKQGFPMHSHSNFEIITIVMKGAVTHEDSMGNNVKVHAGEVQVMSAGTGVVHGEYNVEDEPLELFQIWIEPNVQNVAPRYDQRHFDPKGRQDELQPIVTGEEGTGALMIYQNAKLSLLDAYERETFEYPLTAGRGVYLFVIEGSAVVGETELSRRDALCVWDTDMIPVSAQEGASFLFIEVPV